MLRPRLIPCLLVHNRGLVKTVRFTDRKYVGDPINAVRTFNEKLVDELMVLDIDATMLKREPDYRMIANLANESRMPLCYGGGIATLGQIDRVISLGVEKVALSSAIIADPGLAARAADRVGAQSIVLVLDVKKTGLFRHYEVVTHNATRRTGLDPVQFVARVANSGVGEVVINAVDRDGTMEGYDLELVSRIRDATSLPITVLGGAGSTEHIADLWKRESIVGAGAGSLFVFKGKYRAVLISYPNESEKAQLLARAGWSA